MGKRLEDLEAELRAAGHAVVIDFEFGEGNRHHGPSGEWFAKVDGLVVARVRVGSAFRTSWRSGCRGANAPVVVGGLGDRPKSRTGLARTRRRAPSLPRAFHEDRGDKVFDGPCARGTAEPLLHFKDRSLKVAHLVGFQNEAVECATIRQIPRRPGSQAGHPSRTSVRRTP